MAAVSQFGHGLSDHAQSRVVTDVAGETGAGAEKNIVDDIGFHDAGRVGQARDHHDGIEQARVIGGDDQRSFVAQGVELAEIEAAGPDEVKRAEVEAEQGGDGAAPEQVSPAPGQDVMERYGERRPGQ